ncbi:MAG: DUF6694 family lipoprotein [Chthoniobacteraceae bacterium]
MTRRSLLLLTISLAVVLAGCGKPKIDGSTDQKMRESLEKVRAALPESSRSEFDESLKIIAFADVNGFGDLIALAQAGGLDQNTKSRIAGKNAFEIIAEGQRIKAERTERQRQEAISEMKALRTKLENESPDLLSKFVVERSRLGQTNSGFVRENSIELAVRNNTGKAISRVRFQAILLTPGREVPWMDSGFSYEISGGLESGESATWNLRPNMFGKWTEAPAGREDTILIVRPVRLDGADGKSLTGEHFSEEDEKKLRELLNSVHCADEVQLKATLEARTKVFAQWREKAVADGIKAERGDLLKMKAAAAEAQQSIAKFVVEKSHFYYSEGRFSSDPVIDLTVRNGTGQTVSRFYAHGVLSSPGRETPWLDKEFNYSIRGGMQSGEVQNLELAPNRFTEWGKAPKDKSDMVLTVTIKRLDGADGKKLFEAEFTEKSAARLAALEKIIESQGWK